MRPSPEELRDVALSTAREAGELILRLRAEGVEVAGTKSSDIDIVTLADQAAETLVRQRLLKDRPDDGMVELAGPESLPVAGFVGRYLAAIGDRRRVVADPEATYFGSALDARGLNPGPGPILGPTRFEEWIGRPGARA